MKKKGLQKNSNGITVCDSIVMSVKKKRVNFRQAEGVIIAVIGYVSVIMSFLNMFEFNYNKNAVFFSGLIFSIVYIFISLSGRKAGWITLTSVIVALTTAYRAIDTISDGFQYIYNVIFHTAFHTEINYYKFLNPANEEHCTTVSFIFFIWLMAAVMYFFTIHHPNPILPLLVTFPVIEIGLYNGIELPIFWGILVIAYWLAVLAMSTIDAGEYTGGNGGFVRKENMFFPKRQMRLKVTEKCGIFIMLSVIVVALISASVIKISDYKRSEEINRKRIEVRDAVMSFSMENFTDSLSNITDAFGFTLKYENHKLGNIDHLRYKDTTDLTVTLDRKCNGAVYLKDYAGSIYENNKWTGLSASEYDSEIFGNFKNYSIYPQDFPYIIHKRLSEFTDIDRTMKIKSDLKGNKSLSPYGTQNSSNFSYTNDTEVSSKKQNGNDYSYNFLYLDTNIAEKIDKMYREERSVYSLNDINNDYWRNAISEYCEEHDLMAYDGFFAINSSIFTTRYDSYNYPEAFMAELLEKEYRDFVYANYLQVPDTEEMEELRLAYADVLDTSEYTDNYPNRNKILILQEIRNRISDTVEYSLDPGKTPSNRDFVNYFLLENQKGYCTHYATATVILARMAGIPARYATGYVIVGDDFNDSNQNNDGSYTIEVKDNRSHAWAEVYIDNYGWIPFECTAGYTGQSIDTTPATTTTATTTTETVTTVAEESQENESNSTESPNTTQTAPKESIATTTATQSETGITLPYFDDETGTGIHIPETAWKIFRIIIAIAVIIFIVYIRRRTVLYMRRKHFKEGNGSKRIAYMYDYAEKLLSELDIEKDEMQYSEFVKLTENKLSGKYFDSGVFEGFVDTALHSSFGNYSPTDEELKNYRIFLRVLSEKIYDNSSNLEKFVMKFVKILI